jgi:hypothetical protein
MRYKRSRTFASWALSQKALSTEKGRANADFDSEIQDQRDLLTVGRTGRISRIVWAEQTDPAAGSCHFNPDPRTPDAADERRYGNTQPYFPKEEEPMKTFNRLLSRRMEQLHLSTNDVAVSLHTSIKDVWDLRRGILLPTEQRIAELALLLDMGKEDLKTAVQQQVNALAEAI